MEASPFLPDGEPEIPRVVALKEISEHGEAYHFVIDGQKSDVRMTRYTCDEHFPTYTYNISSGGKLMLEADVHLSEDSVYIDWLAPHDEMQPEEKESLTIAFIEESSELLTAALRVDFPGADAIQDQLGNVL